MNSEITIFESPEFGKIRTMVMPDGQIAFVGKDVATILGYKDPSRALFDRVYEEDKTTLLFQQSGSNYKAKTTFINESGLYALILSSKLPNVRQFKHWVTSEVLPSIRENGGYNIKKEDYTPEMIMARAILLADATIKEQKEIIAEQAREIEQHHVIIDDLREQTKYLRMIESCPGDVNINQIALDYGWSAIHMNDYLHKLGIQYKQGGQWILYAPYKDCGYVHSKTCKHIDGKVRMHTKWTQLGRRFIYNELRKRDVMPCCER